MLPGPGQYEVTLDNRMAGMKGANSRSGTQLSFKSDMKVASSYSVLGRARIVNPPSIPSHMNIFGYDENEQGQLIKQTSNLIGFTGNSDDHVGPGDYDVGHVKSLGQSHSGVVAWKKPTQQPHSIQNI